MTCINDYISEINDNEDIDVNKIVKSFEKRLKKCFKLYEDNVGFEDYKMTEYDYIVLYTLWKYTNKTCCIEEFLVVMYSYYKIEEFYFPIKLFKTSNCINILLETNACIILEKLIKID